MIIAVLCCFVLLLLLRCLRLPDTLPLCLLVEQQLPQRLDFLLQRNGFLGPAILVVVIVVAAATLSVLAFAPRMPLLLANLQIVLRRPPAAGLTAGGLRPS